MRHWKPVTASGFIQKPTPHVAVLLLAAMMGQLSTSFVAKRMQGSALALASAVGRRPATDCTAGLLLSASGKLETSPLTSVALTTRSHADSGPPLETLTSLGTKPGVGMRPRPPSTSLRRLFLGISGYTPASESP